MGELWPAFDVLRRAEMFLILKCLESHDLMSSYVSLLNLFATALTEISQTLSLTLF